MIGRCWWWLVRRIAKRLVREELDVEIGVMKVNSHREVFELMKFQHWGHFLVYVRWLCLNFSEEEAFQRMMEIKERHEEKIPSIGTVMLKYVQAVLMKCLRPSLRANMSIQRNEEVWEVPDDSPRLKKSV